MVTAPVVALSLPAIFDLVRRSSVKSDSNFVAADEGKTARQVAMSSLALSCLNVRHLVSYLFLDQAPGTPSTKTTQPPFTAFDFIKTQGFKVLRENPHKPELTEHLFNPCVFFKGMGMQAIPLLNRVVFPIPYSLVY